MPLLRIEVQIPALDRLLDFIEAQDKAQTVIDSLTARVTKLTADLKSTLKGAE